MKVGRCMKKIKLCYIINSFKNCGPCNIVLSMIRGIDREKFDVSLINLLDDNDEEYIKILNDLDVKVINLNFSKGFKTLLKGSEISNIINKYDFDIIHVHGHITAMLTKNVSAYKVLTVHNKLYEDFKNSYGPIKGLIINWLYINAMKKFDKVVACSKSSYLKCKKNIKDCTYINNGIWFKNVDKKEISNIRTKIRNELDIPKDARVYIFAGKYSNIKNVETMLNFFSKSLNEDEYLISLGDGALYSKCQVFSSKKIKQLGFKNNVQEYMMASDVYVSFSYTEGFPVSIIEALHYGLTLLLSDIDSHVDIINMNKNYYIGEYFENDNFESFMYKKNLIENSKPNDSKKFQNSYLSADTMMREYQKVYFEFTEREKKNND